MARSETNIFWVLIAFVVGIGVGSQNPRSTSKSLRMETFAQAPSVETTTTQVKQAETVASESVKSAHNWVWRNKYAELSKSHILEVDPASITYDVTVDMWWCLVYDGPREHELWHVALINADSAFAGVDESGRLSMVESFRNRKTMEAEVYHLYGYPNSATGQESRTYLVTKFIFGK